MNKEKIAKLAQHCFQSHPTLILGSGASAVHGLPGMDCLSKWLCDNVLAEGDDEEDAWLLVRTALANKDHLEAALEGKTLPQNLLRKIVEATWECVNEKDKQVYDNLALNLNALPLGKILKHLFSSSNNHIDIVTTNYDRIVEYACNSVGILFQSGFTPGYIQTWRDDPSFRYMKGQKPERTVRIWKVHGSLDWFRTTDGQTFGMPIFQLPKAGLVPQIVTPGLNKYQKTQEDPFRSTMTGADRALLKASAFLCVGYGFRDEHIHPKINQKCRENNVPTVVLARTLTDEAKLFLKHKAGRNFLGLERTEGGSRTYCFDHPDGIDVPEPDLWSIDGFHELTI